MSDVRKRSPVGRGYRTTPPSRYSPSKSRPGSAAASRQSPGKSRPGSAADSRPGGSQRSTPDHLESLASTFESDAHAMAMGRREPSRGAPAARERAASPDKLLTRRTRTGSMLEFEGLEKLVGLEERADSLMLVPEDDASVAPTVVISPAEGAEGTLGSTYGRSDALGATYGRSPARTPNIRMAPASSSPDVGHSSLVTTTFDFSFSHRSPRPRSQWEDRRSSYAAAIELGPPTPGARRSVML